MINLKGIQWVGCWNMIIPEKLGTILALKKGKQMGDIRGIGCIKEFIWGAVKP